MIRLVSLDPIDQEMLDKLTRVVFQAYGLGCEHAGEVPTPPEAARGDALDAVALADCVPPVKSFADDKVVYLTTRRLVPRDLPGGSCPTPGFAQFGGARAVVTAHGLPSGEAQLKRMAKQAVHEVGHLWELHHCLDPRCAMYAPWSPSFAAGEAVLCTFCRDKSEQRIRLAKT